MKLSEMKLRWIFGLKDTIVFGLGALLATAGSFLVLVYHTDRGQLYISEVATGVMWFIFFRLAYFRFRLWRRVSFSHSGIHFITDELPKGTFDHDMRDETIDAVNDTMHLWATTGRDEVTDPWSLTKDTIALLKLAQVDWTDRHAYHEQSRLAGRTLRTKRAIIVSVEKRPMQQGALGHELGHTILKEAGLPYEESDLLEWHNTYGVPY